MNRELVDAQEYTKICDNQVAIINILDDECRELTCTLEQSQRYILESKANFQKGIEAVKRIRANLDDVHKMLKQIAKSQSIAIVIDEE